MGLFNKVRSVTGSVPKELLENGLLGRGVIVSIKQTAVSTGVDFNPARVCEFTVKVALDNEPRYTATCRQAVLATVLPRLMTPGTMVAVRVDANDHSRIALSLGEQPPTVTVSGSDPNTGSAARILEEGVPCKAVIVQTQPLGVRGRQGHDMYAFAVTVLAAGRPPTRSRSATPFRRQRCRCCIRATPCPPGACPTAMTGSWSSNGTLPWLRPRRQSDQPTQSNSTQQRLKSAVTMVLVTGTWRMWLIGTIASLVMFGVVYVTVIKPDNSLARSCRLPGEAASRPSGSPQRPARH